MNNKKPLIAIAGSALFIAIATVGLSVAWFTSVATTRKGDSPIGGIVQDTYYESGDGSEESPYLITRPRHLYNLAWLQDLGFYNKHDGSEDDHQYYFKLGADIDMSRFSAIPPIGTEQNPFVGNFNGDGHVITGVTITNEFSDFTSHPSVVAGWNGEVQNSQPIEKPHILGLFGVVGDYSNTANKPTDYSSAANELKNTAISGATIKTAVIDSLMGVAAGYVKDGDLTDSHHMLKNVVIDNSSLLLPASGSTTSYGNDTSGNALSNISNYSLVGYTNDTTNVVKASKTMYGVNIDTNKVYAATEEGSIAGWGGSIDMLTMFNNLHDIWNILDHDYASNPTVSPLTYYRNKEITINKDGTTTVNSETNATENNMTSSTDSTVDSSSGNYNYFSTDKTDSDSKQTSSYSFVVGDAGQSTETRFMCLTGGKTVEYINGQTLKTNYYDTFYGKKIYVEINGTPYYLKTNGTNDVTATTDSDEASLWLFEDNRIYTEINETQYFLNRSGTNTVNLGTTANTIWNYSSTYRGYFTTYNNNGYYLNCSTTDWNLATITNVEYVLLSDGNGHYITHPSNNGNVGTGTDSTATNARWYVDGNYYKTAANGTAYYLRSNSNSNIGNNSTSTDNMYVSNSTVRRFSLNDGYLYTTYEAGSWWNTYTHYVYAYFNGSEWRETIATGNANPPQNRTIISVERFGTLSDSAKNITFSASSAECTYIKKSRTETVNAPFEVEHTFFPLRSEENKPGIPADTNTGYVVSGGNYSDDEFGDIRVSAYAKNTYLSNGVNTVRTIDASGQNVTTTTYGESNFKKYTAAKSAMQEVLSGNSNVYGLHFMNASIHYGGTNPVIAEKAIVNGVTHYDYELPTDCVDFSLKENGYINFFAGSYYTGNSCFFSLHEVIRSGSTISNIKEIKGVYYDASDTSETKSYSYLYSDGTYSIPFKYTNGVKTQLDGSAYTEHSTQPGCPTGYTLAFDTFRITNRDTNSFSLTNNSAYYFEIPMNEGEYCLGSVSGRNGAYLMYLDIAANAAKVNRTIAYERFKLTESTYSYPTGVSLKSLDVNVFVYNNETHQYNDIDASDSVCMAVQAGANGTFGMDRSGNDVTLNRANTNKAPPNYSGENIDLVHDLNSQTAIDIVAISESDRWIKQMEYYDYMVISDTLIVTTITDVSTDENGTAYTRQSIVQKHYGGNSTSGTLKNTYTYVAGGVDERSSMKLYDHSNQGKRYSVADLINVSTLSISDAKLRPATDANIVLVFKLFQDGGDSYTDSSTISVVGDSNFNQYGTFFTYNGFVIVLTPNSGTIDIEVTTFNPTFTMITTNTANGSTSTTTQTVVVTINGTPITAVGDTIHIS